FREEGLSLPDDFYSGAYRWHPRRDLVVYVKAGALWMVDLTHEKFQPLCLSPKLEGIEPYPLVYTRDGTAVLVRSRSKSGESKLVIAPLEGEPRILRLAGDAARLILTADRQTLWQPVPGTVMAMLPGAGATSLARLDLVTGKKAILREHRG